MRQRATATQKLLKKYGLKSRDLEVICSVSKQAVWKWRHGIASPALASVVPLVRELRKRGHRVSVEDFVRMPMESGRAA